MAFPLHLRGIAEYAVARTVISAAKNVENQFKINKRCLATGRVRYHAEELLFSTAQYLSKYGDFLMFGRWMAGKGGLDNVNNFLGRPT